MQQFCKKSSFYLFLYILLTTENPENLDNDDKILPRSDSMNWRDFEEQRTVQNTLCSQLVLWLLVTFMSAEKHVFLENATAEWIPEATLNWQSHQNIN